MLARDALIRATGQTFTASADDVGLAPTWRFLSGHVVEVFFRHQRAIDRAGPVAVAAWNVGLVRPRSAIPVVAVLPNVATAFEAVRAWGLSRIVAQIRPVIFTGKMVKLFTVQFQGALHFAIPIHDRCRWLRRSESNSRFDFA